MHLFVVGEETSSNIMSVENLHSELQWSKDGVLRNSAAEMDCDC